LKIYPLIISAALYQLIFPVVLAADTSSTENTSSENQALLKSIHSDRVRNIMRRLNSLSYEREITEPELQKIRIRQIKLLLEAADELVAAANESSEILSSNYLNKLDQATFKALANQLQTELKEIRKSARLNHVKQIRKGYQQLRNTCAACHQLFREQK